MATAATESITGDVLPDTTVQNKPVSEADVDRNNRKPEMNCFPTPNSMVVSNVNSNSESWQCVGKFMDLSRYHCQRLYSKNGERNDLALFYNRGQFYAMGAWCGHMGGPLYEGDIEDYRSRPHIMCPWHSYMFDLENGQNELGMEQNVYKVKVEAGKVYVSYECELSVSPYL